MDTKKINYTLMVLILIVTVFAIFLYERYLCFLNIRDAMTRPLLPEPFSNISDGWAISHILLYTLLAFLFPSCLLPLFIVGVVWEILEEIYGWVVRNTSFKHVSCHTERSHMSSWWFGRWHDIVSNSIGLGIGYGLQALLYR
jgi:hypothetical protein